MKRLSISILLSFLILGIQINKSIATENAITLVSINITENSLLADEDLEVNLKFKTPLNFDYDPKSLNINGDLQIIYCPELNLSGYTCSFPTSVSNFRIQNIVSYSTEIFESFNETTVVLKGKINSGEIGKYLLFSIRVAGADLPNRYEMHIYTRGKTYAEELTIPRTDIPVPDFTAGDFSIVESIEEPAPVVPEPEPTVEPVQDPAPVPTQQPVVNNPAPRASVASPSVAAPQVIQSNFYLPAIAGDSNWKPMQQIKGRFDGWKRLKKNAINNGRNQVTKTNGAMITFRSEGDALSLRFLGGKKRGSFSIYVNGELLDRVDAKRKKKRALIKTWEGLGEGNHFIDVVAELTPGESIALNGVHSPRG